jgi:hypothetical protein
LLLSSIKCYSIRKWYLKVYGNDIACCKFQCWKLPLTKPIIKIVHRVEKSTRIVLNHTDSFGHQPSIKKYNRKWNITLCFQQTSYSILIWWYWIVHFLGANPKGNDNHPLVTYNNVTMPCWKLQSLQAYSI